MAVPQKISSICSLTTSNVEFTINNLDICDEWNLQLLKRHAIKEEEEEEEAVVGH
jgi:hypothetical protein